MITNTNDLGPMILQSLAPAFLYVPTPSMNYISICDKVAAPMYGGTTTRFMRPKALVPPTVQLGNSGVDPAAQIPQRDMIDAQMAFFGTGCVINEQVYLQDQEGVLAWVGERLMVSARQAEDLILRDYILSVASPINAGGGNNGDNPTNYAPSDFSLLNATLDSNNAYKFITGIGGEDKYGTVPQRARYIMLASTELQPDFDNMQGQGFTNVWAYPNNQPVMPTEYGSVFNIGILTSSESPVARGVSAMGRDVYYNPVMGKQAVTHVSQNGYSMRLMYRGPEYSGMLMQNVSIAIKFAQAQAVTQDTAIRNSLCTRLFSIGV